MYSMTLTPFRRHDTTSDRYMAIVSPPLGEPKKREFCLSSDTSCC